MKRPFAALPATILLLLLPLPAPSAAIPPDAAGSPAPPPASGGAAPEGSASPAPATVDATARAPAADDPYAPLDPSERATLLRVAWRILTAHLKEQEIRDEDLPTAEFTPRLTRPRGCFVALRRSGQLRGMQGEIEESRPLLRQVAVFTRRAATRDPRFEPLTDLDLPALEVEISVIGPRHPIAGPEGFDPHTQGIYLEKWGRRALFLPGVAAAQGWTAERTLVELCKQASLPAGSWSSSARLEVFTTEVISGREPPSAPAAAAPSPVPTASPPAAASPAP